MLVRVCELVLNQDPKHAVFAYPAELLKRYLIQAIQMIQMIQMTQVIQNSLPAIS